MTKLIKFLKPYIWWIVAIFALLFGQAMADLSLPGYMADIVNVGIQQNGIQNSVAEVLRPVEFTRLTLFMSAADKAAVIADYTLLDGAALSSAEYNTDVKRYPLLATSPLYVLNAIDQSQTANLDRIFSRTMPVVANLEQNGVAALAGSGLPVPAGVDPFSVIAQLSPQQMDTLRTVITDQISAL